MLSAKLMLSLGRSLQTWHKVLAAAENFMSDITRELFDSVHTKTDFGHLLKTFFVSEALWH